MASASLFFKLVRWKKAKLKMLNKMLKKMLRCSYTLSLYSSRVTWAGIFLSIPVYCAESSQSYFNLTYYIHILLLHAFCFIPNVLVLLHLMSFDTLCSKNVKVCNFLQYLNF